MVFSDSTVSRKHFEIGYDEAEDKFWLQVRQQHEEGEARATAAPAAAA